jgi:hypothetical protein
VAVEFLRETAVVAGSLDYLKAQKIWEEEGE